MVKLAPLATTPQSKFISVARETFLGSRVNSEISYLDLFVLILLYVMPEWNQVHFYFYTLYKM